MELDYDEMEAHFGDKSKEFAREAANRWFSETQEILQNEGDRLEWEIFPVVQSGVPPFWDSSAEGYRFGYTHMFAPIANYGAEPFEIPVGDKGYLAWKDEDTGEWIYTSKPVQHPGFPSLRYIERGMRNMEKQMEEKEADE